MRLSVVVTFHDMQREAARTLYSLSPSHQQDVTVGDYEVIAVDNGSAVPLTEEFVTGFGPNFRLITHDTTSVSPVAAINLGAVQARGDAIAVIVDGARMATPGLIRHTLTALALATKPVVFTRSWHLGPDVQNITVPQGYDQATEDALLEQANWRADGYALFTISTLDNHRPEGSLVRSRPSSAGSPCPAACYMHSGAMTNDLSAPAADW